MVEVGADPLTVGFRNFRGRWGTCCQWHVPLA